MNIGRLIIVDDGRGGLFTIHIVINNPTFFVGICFDKTHALNYIHWYSKFMRPQDLREAAESIESSNLPVLSFENEPLVFELSPGKELAYSFNAYFEALTSNKVFLNTISQFEISGFSPETYITVFPEPSEWILTNPGLINSFSSILFVPENSWEMAVHEIYSKQQWYQLLTNNKFLSEYAKEGIRENIDRALLPEISAVPMRQIRGRVTHYLFTAAHQFLTVYQAVGAYGDCRWSESAFKN